LKLSKRKSRKLRNPNLLRSSAAAMLLIISLRHDAQRMLR
jgi:hypothetical protein